jgi:membrane protease YdiL (CAAX protease family)
MKFNEASKSPSIVKKAIITFIILNFVLSSIFYFFIISFGSLNAVGGLYTFLLMWCPAIAAIITSFIFFKSIKEFGWKPGKIKYLIAAYTIPIMYITIAYGIFWVLDLGVFTGNIPANIIIFIVMGTVLSIMFALGEEIGWRGFLVPQLSKITTFNYVVLISGAIWALWHFPIIIFGSYTTGTPLWYSLPIFTLGILASSIILAWLRLKSGSLWPAVLLHASHDFYLGNMFDPLTSGTLSHYLVGETGILLLAVLLAFALIFWKMRNKLPNTLISGAK